MPIGHEEARRRIEQRRAAPPPRRTPLAAKLPGVGKAVRVFFDDDRIEPRQILAALGASGRLRRAVFATAAPGLADALEATWRSAGTRPYQRGWERLPFRAPGHPEWAQERALWGVRQLVRHTADLRPDVVWLVRWAGHLDGWAVDPETVGRLAAAAIDAGEEEVLRAIDAILDGTDPEGVMGRHVPVALLASARPDCWERAERLLLAAQRQEGLRQSILEVVDEAQPAAFIRIVRLILEHDLVRFASVVRAASVWVGAAFEAGQRRELSAFLTRLLELLENAEARAAALERGTGAETHLALWAYAFRDVEDAIAHATRLLGDADVERRGAAVDLLRRTRVEPSVGGLVAALADPDLRVAAAAVAGLSAFARDTVPPILDELDALLARLPAKRTDLEPLVLLPGRHFTRQEVGGLLFRHRSDTPVDRVVAHLDALDSWERRRLAEQLDARHRDTLLSLLGDPSPDVRGAAIERCAELTLGDDEALALEPLLRRKPGDLRRGVLALIAGRGDAWTAAAAERLVTSKDAQQRLAGVELLRRLAGAEGPEAAAARERLGSLEETDAVVAQATVEATATSPFTSLTEADGFGLMDPARLTPPAPPRERSPAYATPAAWALVTALDAAAHEHREVEVELLDSYGGGTTRQMLGALAWYELRRGAEALPIAELFAPVVDAAPQDADGLTLQRATLVYDALGERVDASVKHRVLGGGRAVLEYEALVGFVLRRLAHERAHAAAVAWTLDVVEDMLAHAPPAALAFDNWKHRDHFVGLARARELRAARPELFTEGQSTRLWALERWLCERPTAGPPERVRHRRASDRMTARPPLEVTIAAFEAGTATEDDLVDHLVGPRGPHWSFGDLRGLTVRGGVAEDGGGPRTQAVVARIRDRIVEVELARGEEPTQAAVAAASLSHSGGLDVLVRALVALRRETFVRGWAADGEGRATVFSHLVQVSAPGAGDTPERFAEAVRASRVPAKRLRELACYAPQWAGHVEHALGVGGLAGAVWWLHAHTKDDRWDVDRQVRETWEAEVAARTELSGAELVDGAVDVAWFETLRERPGDAELTALLRAAKYGSTAGGHKRAELFARAMRGEVVVDELVKRIEDKRHQDTVRALGLVPLAADRDADVLARYEVAQRFLRESRQFGAQRQASERRAVEICLDNLARTAGYRDPVRLAWAMEAEAVADLRDGLSVVRDDLTVTLRIDAHGRPETSAVRGEKRLKAVPAAARKDPEVKALTARTTELRRQAARIKSSLEQAMVRGDAITGEELARYAEHALLWPPLRSLVLVGDDIAGLPDAGGRVLLDPDGHAQAIGTTETLRVAHPLDLLERGSWSAWQRHVLAQKVKQPFKQVFRELYVPVAAERTAAEGSRRYAGHQVQPARTRALLGGRGWTLSADEGARRVFHHERVSVSLWFLNGFGSPVDVEPPTLEEVRFHAVGDGGPVPLDAVPPRLFSEVMRDLDLVVSVAHVGGVDPEASRSTIGMRAALVSETAGLLGVENVRVEEPRVKVDGQLGSYAVHLGSAQVQRLPGGSVCIVPVHAQHRGRVFLPFADDDPKTAEVVSKVLLLARDHEIRDPTILGQLRA